MYKKKLSDIADYRIACSDIAAAWMFTEESMEKNGITIWKNSIDLEKFQFDCICNFYNFICKIWSYHW